MAPPPPVPPPPSADLAAVLEQQLRADTLRVPPYPAVASQLQRMAGDEQYGVGDVSAVVAADAALAALVLRRANAADLAPGGSTTSLGAAVLRVGVNNVIRLALASSVGAAANAPGPLVALRRDEWRRSLFGALACQELARRRGVSPEAAFIAGLLHDFGGIVVLATLEGLAAAHRLPVMPAAAWRRAVQQFHVPVGLAVARRWNLPEVVVAAIAYHHQPADAPPALAPLVGVVAAIDHAIAVLDRAPERGVAALAEVTALRPDEREMMGKVIPLVAAQMASFESDHVGRDASGLLPLIAPPPPVEGMAPVQFAVDVKGTTTPFRATHISDGLLAINGRAGLKPGAMCTVTLRCEPSPILILVTVQTCETSPVGGFTITLQPFGLAEGDRKVWLDVSARAAANAGGPSAAVAAQAGVSFRGSSAPSSAGRP